MFFAFKMYMSKLLILLFILFGASSFSQDASKHELEILSIINQARTDPQSFLQKIALPYIESNNLKSNSYAQSLIRDLKKQEPVAIISIDSSLQEMAKKFAIHSGKKGVFGHARYNQRYNTYGSHLNYDGENIQYGLEQPLDIVMDLLIDEGIASLGHRKNILSSDFSVIGIGFAKHKRINYNTVMAFGGF